jgi:hypothetical protein
LIAVSVLLACAAAAGAAGPRAAVSAHEALPSARSATQLEIPAGYKLLSQTTVPATTPFNGGVRLKTIFRSGQTYYLVASGTVTLADGAVTLDPVYCIDADPPIGACPPAVPPTYWGGINFIWFQGKTFANYLTSVAYGDQGQGWIKYQPSHRYVYKFTAPGNSSFLRLSLGGPNSSSPSTASGAFSIAVYGTPPPSYFDLRGYPCGTAPSDTAIVVSLSSGCLRVVLTTEAAPWATAANGYSFAIQHLVTSLATGKLEWQGLEAVCGRGESDVVDEPVWRCHLNALFQESGVGEQHFRAFMYQGDLEKPTFIESSGPLTVTVVK